MAGKNEDFVTGEEFDLLFEWMEDGDLEEHYGHDFAEAADELVENAKRVCSDCKKEYKTESGLARHQRAKHPKPQDHVDQQKSRSIDETTITGIIVEAMQDIADDECFPGEIRSVAKHSVFEIHNKEMLQEISKLYQSLCKNSNAERFYSSFYETIVFKASIFFHPLQMPICTMLSTRVADKLLAYFNKPTTVLPPSTKKINQRELDGLQYLAGYVVHSLVRKIHRHQQCKTKEAQDMLIVLNSARSIDLESQRLVKCQTRGGLWGVKSEVQHLFKIVEEHFRNLENCHTLSIDIKKITRNLMSDVNIVSLFNTVVENSECSIDKEAKLNLLQKMIELYLRVRAFSMAKAKTLLESKKARGLRKGVKTQSQKRNETSS